MPPLPQDLHADAQARAVGLRINRARFPVTFTLSTFSDEVMQD